MNFKHGMRRTAIYSVWSSMMRRCYSETDAAYPNYGGRGIYVCIEWHDFRVFYEDIGRHRTKGMTLDREDNNKGYSPQNCRWATRVEQGRNKRNNVLINIDGETLPLSAWSERFGIKYGTVHRRITAYGWTPEQALKAPLVTRRKGIPRGRRVQGFGQDQMVKIGDCVIPVWRAAEMAGLDYETVARRIRRGWSVEAAVSLQPKKGPRKAAFGASHNVTFHDTPAQAA